MKHETKPIIRQAPLVSPSGNPPKPDRKNLVSYLVDLMGLTGIGTICYAIYDWNETIGLIFIGASFIGVAYLIALARR